MRLLLDTHVFLWSLSDTPHLTRDIRDVIRDPGNDVYVSVVTLWELSIKAKLGKIELPGPAETWLPRAAEETGFETVEISAAHAVTAGQLPLHHGDPFDRLLVAQAMIERLTLASRDPFIARYDVRVLTA